MMSTKQNEQRPEPRFRVGQVCVLAICETCAPLKVKEVLLRSGVYFYRNHRNSVWAESLLRPLSAEEIGGDEVTRLSELLLAADSRRDDMMRERNEARAKLAAARELCGKMLNLVSDTYKLSDGWIEAISMLEDFCHEPVRLKNMLAAAGQVEDFRQSARAVTAEAEQELAKEGE